MEIGCGSMELFRGFFDSLGITEFVKPSIGITDVLDILIVAYIIYKIIFWIKETRAWALFKGILVIFALAAVASILKLNTILWILSNTISVGIIALLIVFQPEMRKALEQLGKGKFFSYFTRSDDAGDEKAAARTVDEIVKAAGKMGAVKTGALILMEQEVPLGDLERTGIPIDAIVSSQLLINIFVKDTPLHDGATIIQNGRISAAACFLPLSDNPYISTTLGTRHRAGIGLSEVSDAMIIIVSEETGNISLAQDGKLIRQLDERHLRELLGGQMSSSSSSSVETSKKKEVQKDA